MGLVNGLRSALGWKACKTRVFAGYRRLVADIGCYIHPPAIEPGKARTIDDFAMGFPSVKSQKSNSGEFTGNICEHTIVKTSLCQGLATSATCHSAKTSFCNGTAFVTTTPSCWPAPAWPGGNCYVSRPAAVIWRGTRTSASFLGFAFQVDGLPGHSWMGSFILSFFAMNRLMY